MLRLTVREAGRAFARCAAAEEALEEETRVRLRCDGGIRRTPGEIILVGAGVTGVAVAGFAHGITGQLQRRKARQVADLVRDDLIDGDAGLDVRAGGLLHAHAGEERAAGARVIACAVGAGRGVHVVHATEHLELMLHGRERLQRATEVEVRAFVLRPPRRLDRAIREIDIGHAQWRASRGAGEVRGLAIRGEQAGGHDGFERGQRHASAEAAEEIAAAQAGEALGGGVWVVMVGFHG